MSLRSKLIVAICLSSLLITGTACWIVTQISFRSLNRLEQAFAQQNVQRVKESLQAEANNLEKSMLSYSWWEETQAFVKQENPGFVEDMGTIFEEMPIQVLVVSNLRGEIQYSQYKDADLSPELLQSLAPYLQSSADEDKVKVNLMTIHEQPAFLVIAPVLNNNGEMPSVGRMVALRYLNQDFINELSKQTQLSLSYYLNSELEGSIKAQEQSTWQEGQAIFRNSDQSLLSYIPIQNQAGDLAFVIEVEASRDIYHQGLRTLTYLLLTVGVASLVSLVAIYFLIHRILLWPLGQMSRDVGNITTDIEGAKHIAWTSQDELGELSKDINQMLDVLEQKTQQLEFSKEELERSNKELEQFAYVASHDLQEPLRKVQTFSERLSKKYAHVLDDDGKLYIERMQDASSRMRILIQDLLSYSRVKSAGNELVMVDLNEILKGVVSDLEIRLEQSGGRVELETLPAIQADPLQMRQIFQNLIGNALKFKKPDLAPVVKVSSLEVSKGFFEITIADNGIGFDNKYAERVFEVFQRLHGRSEYEGTGMGLAIVRKIIERHKGSIRAQSEPGQGSTFILRLPGVQKNDFKTSQTIIKELV